MRALQFWKAVTMDRSDFLDRALAVLEEFDVAIAIRDLPRAEKAFAEHFEVRRFAHSLNVSAPDSRLRLQIQTDPRYESFVGRARIREVMELQLPVATPEDVLQGKVWAVQDEGRRPSKRQKDLADISRLVESDPELRQRVPAEILSRLFQ